MARQRFRERRQQENSRQQKGRPSAFTRTRNARSGVQAPGMRQTSRPALKQPRASQLMSFENTVRVYPTFSASVQGTAAVGVAARRSSMPGIHGFAARAPCRNRRHEARRKKAQEVVSNVLQGTVTHAPSSQQRRPTLQVVAASLPSLSEC